MGIKPKRYKDFSIIDESDYEIEDMEEQYSKEQEEINKSTKMGEIQ